MHQDVRNGLDAPGRAAGGRAAPKDGPPLLPAQPPQVIAQASGRPGRRYLMLPEPRLATLLKLPFAMATFTSPAWAVLPYPTWAKLGLEPLEWR